MLETAWGWNSSSNLGVIISLPCWIWGDISWIHVIFGDIGGWCTFVMRLSAALLVRAVRRSYAELDYARHMPSEYVERMKRTVPKKVYGNRFGAPAVIRWTLVFLSHWCMSFEEFARCLGGGGGGTFLEEYSGTMSNRTGRKKRFLALSLRNWVKLKPKNWGREWATNLLIASDSTASSAHNERNIESRQSPLFPLPIETVPILSLPYLFMQTSRESYICCLLVVKSIKNLVKWH